MPYIDILTIEVRKTEECLHSCADSRDLLSFVLMRSFEDGLKLVQLRGESMQAAADAQPSAMVSVIGLDAEKVPLLGREGEENDMGFTGTASGMKVKKLIAKHPSSI